MDPRPTFNLDELDAETRTLAESAARREGIPPEEWIQRVIMRRLTAAAEPVPAPPAQPIAPQPQPTPPAPQPVAPPPPVQRSEPEPPRADPEPARAEPAPTSPVSGMPRPGQPPVTHAPQPSPEPSVPPPSAETNDDSELDSIQSQLEALARAAESGRFRPSDTAAPASTPAPAEPERPVSDLAPERPVSEAPFAEPSQEFEDSFSAPPEHDREPPVIDPSEGWPLDAESTDQGPSADDRAVAEALDALASRVGASEQNIDEILSPLELAVRGLERQLESLEQGPAGKAEAKAAPIPPERERPAAETHTQAPVETSLRQPVRSEADEKLSQPREQARETASDLLATLEAMNARIEAGELDRSSPGPAAAERPPERNSDPVLEADAPSTAPERASHEAFQERLDPITPLRTAAERDSDDAVDVLELEDRVDDGFPRRDGAAAAGAFAPQASARDAERDHGRRVDWFEPIEERPERFERTGSAMGILRAILLIVVLAGALAIAAWVYFRGDDPAGVMDELKRLTDNPAAIFERGASPEEMAEPAPATSSASGGPRLADATEQAQPTQAGKPEDAQQAKASAAPSVAAPLPSAETSAQPTPSASAPSTSPAPPPPAPQAARQTASRPPETGSLEERIAWLKDAAQRGDSNAQHDLAILYAQGNGLEQDYPSAAHWFREAAVQGIANAQYNLGVLHERGLGVQQDPLEALLWYLSAAEQGHAAAQYNVGVSYAEGKGIPQNYSEAIKWFEKAALQGLPRAQYNLGIMMEDGLGGTPDLVEAARWYTLAAQRGEADAQERREEIAAKLTAEQLAEVDRLLAETEIMAEAPPPSAVRPAAVGQSAAAPPPPARPAMLAMADRSVIAEIQQILTRLNFDPGPADGLVGDRTRFAIREYQTTMGLDVTGEPSQELLANLREVAGR